MPLMTGEPPILGFVGLMSANSGKDGNISHFTFSTVRGS